MFFVGCKSFESEVLQKLQELVIILALNNKLYLLVKQISLYHIDLWKNFLYGAVNNTNHIFVLANLGSPHKVHDFIGKGSLLS